MAAALAFRTAHTTNDLAARIAQDKHATTYLVSLNGRKLSAPFVDGVREEISGWFRYTDMGPSHFSLDDFVRLGLVKKRSIELDGSSRTIYSLTDAGKDVVSELSTFSSKGVKCIFNHMEEAVSRCGFKLFNRLKEELEGTDPQPAQRLKMLLAVQESGSAKQSALLGIKDPWGATSPINEKILAWLVDRSLIYFDKTTLRVLDSEDKTVTREPVYGLTGVAEKMLFYLGQESPTSFADLLAKFRNDVSKEFKGESTQKSVVFALKQSMLGPQMFLILPRNSPIIREAYSIIAESVSKDGESAILYRDLVDIAYGKNLHAGITGFIDKDISKKVAENPEVAKTISKYLLSSCIAHLIESGEVITLNEGRIIILTSSEVIDKVYDFAKKLADGNAPEVKLSAVKEACMEAGLFVYEDKQAGRPVFQELDVEKCLIILAKRGKLAIVEEGEKPGPGIKISGFFRMLYKPRGSSGNPYEELGAVAGF